MIPLPEGMTPDTPLRLKEAARIAFPDGSLNVSGLRREISRGRLTSSMIAGKQFTTIRDVLEMIELCRVNPKEPGYGSNPNIVELTAASSAERPGSLEMERGRSALAALKQTATGLKRS